MVPGGTEDWDADGDGDADSGEGVDRDWAGFESSRVEPRFERGGREG